MLKSEADPLTHVVFCTPGQEYYAIKNLKAHNILEWADPQKALAQHDRLKERMRVFGAGVIDVPELEGHPNSVFTRDTALCTPRGSIRLVPGIDTREAEGDWMASVLDGMGEPCAGQVLSPGTVDGGEVGFVGLAQRTNEAGYAQLSGF